MANNVSGLIGIALGKGAALQHAAPRCSVSAAAFSSMSVRVSGCKSGFRQFAPKGEILGGGQDK
jgi:hypothetical protein